MTEKRDPADTAALKNKVLAAIRAQPLYRHDIVDMFGLNRMDTTNFLMSLKKVGLIEMYKPDLVKPHNFRRWAATARTESYEECIRLIRKKYIARVTDDARQKKVEFHPLANPAMCVTADDHHVSVRKEKISPWSGYQSMGGLG